MIYLCPHPQLLICTWFLKNQFWKIKFDELNFQSISNLIFSACVACKIWFRNCFLQAKNPVFWTWPLQLDFSKIKYRATRGKGNKQKRHLLKISPFSNSCEMVWDSVHSQAVRSNMAQRKSYFHQFCRLTFSFSSSSNEQRKFAFD